MTNLLTTSQIDAFLRKIAESRTLMVHEIGRKGRRLSMNGAQLYDRIKEWSQVFAGAGLGPGARLVLPIHRTIDSVAVLLAAWEREIFVLVVKPSNPLDFICDFAREIGADAMFLDPARSKLMATRGHEIQETFDPLHTLVKEDGVPLQGPLPEGCGLGILTSGSTGAPRVVLHRPDRVLLNAEMHLQAIGLNASDTIALSLSFNYSYGLVAGLLAGLLAEAQLKLCVHDIQGTPEWYLDNGITLAMTTPFEAAKLMPTGAFTGMRAITVGGDVTGIQLARSILENYPGLTLFGTYGLSEAGPRVATLNITRELCNDLGVIPLGRPLAGVSLELAPLEGHPHGGELVVQSPTLMLGYLNHPEESERLIDPINMKLKTGDIFVERGGELVFASRKKRIIFNGSEKIYPSLVENEIQQFDSVKDVWVTSVQHPEHGEVPKIYVVANGDQNLRQFEKHLRKRVPRSCLPDSWEVVSELPREARK